MPSPDLPCPKLLWVHVHEPKIYARAAQVLFPKDAVRYRLTSTFTTDRAGVGGTLMLVHPTRDWSADVLSGFDIPPWWLPTTHEGTTHGRDFGYGSYRDRPARWDARCDSTPPAHAMAACACDGVAMEAMSTAASANKSRQLHVSPYRVQHPVVLAAEHEREDAELLPALIHSWCRQP